MKVGVTVNQPRQNYPVFSVNSCIDLGKPFPSDGFDLLIFNQNIGASKAAGMQQFSIFYRDRYQCTPLRDGLLAKVDSW